jgi:uncharacterized protein YdhG (YjbR/CyaY superfamily)
MRKQAGPAGTVDAYIRGFPPEVRQILEKVRSAVRSAAPGAVEKISYGMPAFWQNRILVYFAAHTKHLGFYPGVEAITAFQKELSRHVTSKGTVQFPYDAPIPLGLIRKMVAFRVRACASTRTSPEKRAPRQAQDRVAAGGSRRDRFSADQC